MTDNPESLRGGCLCGAVRYECVESPSEVAVCYCSHCQKQSGSALSIIAAFPVGAIKINLDHLKTYKDIGESGKTVLRLFCQTCGSPVMTKAEFSPEFEFIKAGTFDDTSWLKPASAYWCEHKHEWLESSESLTPFARNPVGDET
jgi:hypothetical protein